MDQLNRVITSVMTAMGPKLEPEQLEELRNQLYRTLKEYDITQKETAIAPYEVQIPEEYSAFLWAKKSEGKSDKTLELYGLYMREMVLAIQKPLAKITAYDIRMYLGAKQKQTGCGNRTMDTRRSVLSSWFGWMAGEGIIDRNPMATVRPYKYERNETRSPLTKTQMEAMRTACKNERELAIVLFLATSGARVSELCGLNRSDLDMTTGIVKLFGKGSKHRTAKISAAALLHTQNYLNSRTDDNEALFVGAREPHKRVTKGSIEELIRNIGQRAGLGRVFPHRLRHTFATDALHAGMPVTQLQSLLGHSSLDTTMIYARVDMTDVLSSYNRCF